MRNCFLKRFLQISSSSRFLNSSRRYY
ncbi:hypothetical protein F383_00590 [Gossypium arboreum]|uniref:Uncharacterized protein n=1 Tax=Gossypium arboreum TaxID=29729 RepID=A0A0B0NRJ3_GOSAR|nr:hypothetical protein F383_00590 [Gossypium arboreum]